MIYKTEMITVDGVTTLTAATIASALADRAKVSQNGTIKRVVCTVETASIRVTGDGSNPTSSAGHLLNIGDIYIVNAGEISDFRAIKVSAAGKIAASYEV